MSSVDPGVIRIAGHVMPTTSLDMTPMRKVAAAGNISSSSPTRVNGMPPSEHEVMCEFHDFWHNAEFRNAVFHKYQIISSMDDKCMLW